MTQRDFLLDNGTWSYRAGVDGTINLGAADHVIGIACRSAAGGSLRINGGDLVPVPANAGISITPQGVLKEASAEPRESVCPAIDSVAT